METKNQDDNPLYMDIANNINFDEIVIVKDDDDDKIENIQNEIKECKEVVKESPESRYQKIYYCDSGDKFFGEMSGNVWKCKRWQRNYAFWKW